MSKCGLFWVYRALFWMGGGEWGWREHYFGRRGVSEYFGWVGVGGVGWGWMGLSGGGWG